MSTLFSGCLNLPFTQNTGANQDSGATIAEIVETQGNAADSDLAQDVTEADGSTAGSEQESLKESADKQELSEDTQLSGESTSPKDEESSNGPESGSDESSQKDTQENEFYSFITTVENGPVDLEDVELEYTASEKSISYKDMEGTRTITAVWPFFIHDKGEDMFGPANSAILDEYIISVINGFIEMTDEGAAEGINGPFLLEINYRLEFTSNRLLSVMFHHYTFEGGAHPNTMNYSYNYDIKEKSQIFLYSYLFSEGYDFLSFLSGYCYEDIRRQYREGGLDLANVDSWIKDGTDPSEPENFENFFFTEDAFAVHFDAYEVGPYVAGPFTVMIPYEEFEGNLLYP